MRRRSRTRISGPSSYPFRTFFRTWISSNYLSISYKYQTSASFVFFLLQLGQCTPGGREMGWRRGRYVQHCAQHDVPRHQRRAVLLSISSFPTNPSHRLRHVVNLLLFLIPSYLRHATILLPLFGRFFAFSLAICTPRKFCQRGLAAASQ